MFARTRDVLLYTDLGDRACRACLLATNLAELVLRVEGWVVADKAPAAATMIPLDRSCAE